MGHDLSRGRAVFRAGPAAHLHQRGSRTRRRSSGSVGSRPSRCRTTRRPRGSTTCPTRSPRTRPDRRGAGRRRVEPAACPGDRLVRGARRAGGARGGSRSRASSTTTPTRPRPRPAPARPGRCPASRRLTSRRTSRRLAGRGTGGAGAGVAPRFPPDPGGSLGGGWLAGSVGRCPPTPPGPRRGRRGGADRSAAGRHGWSRWSPTGRPAPGPSGVGSPRSVSAR